MIRYRLDDLGWYQFENLIQILIKAQFSVAIQSWGGRGDWGIDAYYQGKLTYPSKNDESEGAFVFQVKFVENANASGAKSENTLINAVKAEIRKLKESSKYSWVKEVTHYILITNAPLSAATRKKIAKLFHEVFPISRVYSHNGTDVCDWLDINRHICKAFPQLLSLRDLETILSEIVNRHIIIASKAIIEEAKEISAVFVPTEAYRHAREVLKKHKFVVLDGPPEVGKTTIAYMIGLTLVIDEWTAIYCSEPKDLLQVFDTQQKQVFIADDAFGRTEYDPGRGKLWEKELPRILRLLSAQHFLIFTSRKHILERAYKDLDLQDKSKDFPKLAEVVVDANALTANEKALILYRHAKAENLTAVAKEIVKNHAKAVVLNPNFTPERIRRFFRERLPELSSLFRNGDIDSTVLSKAVTEAIDNPTDRMIKAYDKLSPSHKWFLASLVAEGGLGYLLLPDLERTYSHYCPIQDGWTPFSELTVEMSEAFIKVNSWGTKKYVSWIHPSYRDLVIDKLATDNVMSSRLMERAPVEIIVLAVSDAGGSTGERRLPLLNSEERWPIFYKRCMELINEVDDDREIGSMLASLQSSYSNSSQHVKDKIKPILQDFLDNLLIRWNSRNMTISPSLLRLYYTSSCAVTDKYLPSPNLLTTWNNALEEFKDGVELWKDHGTVLVQELDNWIDLIDVLYENEPRFLKFCSFPSKYREILKTFFDFAGYFLTNKAERDIYNELGIMEKTVSRWVNDPDDPDDGDVADVRSLHGKLDNLKDEMTKTREFCEVLLLALKDKYDGIDNVVSKLADKEDELGHKVSCLEDKCAILDSETSDEEAVGHTSNESFDIDNLFIDL